MQVLFPSPKYQFLYLKTNNRIKLTFLSRKEIIFPIVAPNPSSPLSVSFNSSTSFETYFSYLVTINWAIRSLLMMIVVSLDRLIKIILFHTIIRIDSTGEFNTIPFLRPIPARSYLYFITVWSSI